MPKQPPDTLRLNELIEEQLALGAQLKPPVGGLNRQAVQMVDIDGDGIEEALVFYQTQEENNLSIVLYHKVGEEYKLFTRIDNVGEEIESIEFEDIDKDGTKEIIVVWRLGQGAVKALTVHTLSDGQILPLLSTICHAYAMQHFSGEGNQSLLVFRQDEEVSTGVADLYGFDGLEMSVLSQAPLSASVEAIQRIRKGQLSDDKPAIFVTSQYITNQYDTSAVLTDIFCLVGGDLQNITLDKASGISMQTKRDYLVPVCTDIDGDGVLDVPAPYELPPYNADADPSNIFMVIRWCSYGSNGVAHTTKTTYHNYTDNWFFDIPESWLAHLTMNRTFSPGEKGYIFALRVDDDPRDQLAIYSLVGDDRGELSKKDGRVVVNTLPEMIIAAEILPTALEEFAISQEELLDRILWIEKEWNIWELSQ